MNTVALRTLLIAPALLFAGGCGTNPGEPEVQRLVDALLDFCSDDVPTWFAYQNEGQPWTPLTPNAEGTYSFTAHNRLALAFVHQVGADYATQVVFTTNDDLEEISGLACLEETGTKTLKGSIIGHVGSQLALTGMSFSSAYLTSQQTSFSLTALADRPLDLVASRVILNGPVQQSDRVVIRRSVNLVHNSTMPLVDLASSEALIPVTASATVSGIQSGEYALLLNNFFSQLETSHTLTYLDPPINNGAQPFTAVPATALATGDYHDLFVLATNADGDVRGAERFFRNPANQALTLGAAAPAPLITTVSATPYARLRVRVASQPDYGSYVAADFFQQSQQFSATALTLSASAGYFRGTPPTWELTMPDLSGVAGWQNSWGLKSGSTDWTVSVFSGRAALQFGAKPADGESVRFALRMSSVNAAQAYRTRHPARTPRRSLFSRSRATD